MRSVNLLFAVFVLCLSSTFVLRSGRIVSEWLSMVSATQGEQPHWITPLATTTPRLEQESRYDIQARSSGNAAVSFKGRLTFKKTTL